MAAALFLLMVLTVFPAGIERGKFGFSAALADDDDDDDDDRVAPAPRPDHVPDEVIMVNPSPAGLERSRTLGFTPYAPETIAGIGLNITRLRPPPNLDAPAALALLRQELPQETSDLNHLYRPQFCRGGICRLPMPSRSPLLLHANAYSCPGARCYGQKMVGWSDELAACSAGLRIGVIDTGADGAHPALKGRKVTAASFAPPQLPPAPTDHGTAVLALLAGAPESPVPGLLPQAEFFLADVFHSPGPRLIEADAVSLARGLGWLKAQGVSAINVSLAGPENRVTEAAIGNVLASGIAVIAAVGNDGPRADPRFPAAIPGVVGVTGVDRRERAYRSAGRGSHVDYAAPAVRIWTAGRGASAGYETGTSFAAPFVTAVLALAADVGDAAIAVKDLGAAGPDPVFGKGLIQAPAHCSARLQ